MDENHSPFPIPHSLSPPKYFFSKPYFKDLGVPHEMGKRYNLFLFQASSGLKNFFQTSSHYHLIRLPETRGLWKAESKK